MNENKNLQPLNETDLSDVSGGISNEHFHIPRHSVGQTIHFFHNECDSKETIVHHILTGTIVEIIHEPEGIFYKVELDEQGKQTLGSSYLTIFIDNVMDWW